MKWIKLIIVLGLSVRGFSQVAKQDTLFFKYDPFYILDGDKVQNNRDQFLLQVSKLQQKSENEGYIYLLKDSILHGTNQKKIISLKETIETKEFYFDGPYNRIINRNKLKTKLLDKYEIILVRNDSFILPKYIQYNTFYPKGKGTFYVDKRVKDTLVFKFNDYNWNTSFHPDLGERIFTLVGRDRRGGLFFRVRDIKEEWEFDSLKVSPKAHIRDIEEYLAYHQTFTKGLKYIYSNPHLADYFEHYEIYIKMGHKYYNIEPVTHED